MRDEAVDQVPSNYDLGLSLFIFVCAVGALTFGLIWAIGWLHVNFGDSIRFYVTERPGTIALVFAVPAALATWMMDRRRVR